MLKIIYQSTRTKSFYSCLLHRSWMDVFVLHELEFRILVSILERERERERRRQKTEYGASSNGWLKENSSETHRRSGCSKRMLNTTLLHFLSLPLFIRWNWTFVSPFEIFLGATVNHFAHRTHSRGWCLLLLSLFLSPSFIWDGVHLRPLNNCSSLLSPSFFLLSLRHPTQKVRKDFTFHHRIAFYHEIRKLTVKRYYSFVCHFVVIPRHKFMNFVTPLIIRKD